MGVARVAVTSRSGNFPILLVCNYESELSLNFNVSSFTDFEVDDYINPHSLSSLSLSQVTRLLLLYHYPSFDTSTTLVSFIPKTYNTSSTWLPPKHPPAMAQQSSL